MGDPCDWVFSGDAACNRPGSRDRRVDHREPRTDNREGWTDRHALGRRTHADDSCRGCWNCPLRAGDSSPRRPDDGVLRRADAYSPRPVEPFGRDEMVERKVCSRASAPFGRACSCPRARCARALSPPHAQPRRRTSSWRNPHSSAMAARFVRLAGSVSIAPAAADRNHARPGGLRHSSAAGFGHDPRTPLGSTLLTGVWRGDNRRDDADYFGALTSLLIRGLQIRAAQSQPGDWVGPAQPRLRTIRLLPYRNCERPVHQPPELGATLTFLCLAGFSWYAYDCGELRLRAPPDSLLNGGIDRQQLQQAGNLQDGGSLHPQCREGQRLALTTPGHKKGSERADTCGVKKR